MLDWRPYHHRSARRRFALLSIGVGILATLLDLARVIAVAGRNLAPAATVALTGLPFLLVAAFLLAAMLRPQWRGPQSLVIQSELDQPAFAAVRSFSTLSFFAILVFWMLKLLERALSGRTLSDVPAVLWAVIVINALACTGGIVYLWQASARRVVLTSNGLTVRRGLRTRTFGWEQIAEGGPKTPSHSSVAIMLWVYRPGAAAPEAYSLQDKHLSIGPDLLAHAIRIYAQAPQRRPLIGSLDELDRLMNELDPVRFQRHPAAPGGATGPDPVHRLRS